jgi:DNA-binding CsgD family transcriptional regulator
MTELALPLHRLTDRQREVFSLLLTGKSNAEIAQTLGVDLSTFNSHMTAILKKLHAKSRVALLAMFVEAPPESAFEAPTVVPPWVTP